MNAFSEFQMKSAYQMSSQLARVQSQSSNESQPEERNRSVAEKKLHSGREGRALQRRREHLTRLLGQIRRGEAGYNLIKKFFEQK